jgi:hypothetical protein
MGGKNESRKRKESSTEAYYSASWIEDRTRIFWAWWPACTEGDQETKAQSYL